MEKLKELLGEELFSQVKEKLGETKVMVDDGNFVPKARLDQVIGERNDLKEQLKERDNQLEDLKKQAGESEELKNKIQALQDQNEQTVNDYEGKLQEQAFNFAVDRALNEDKANPVKAVKALLDLEKIKLDGEELFGLEEQMKGIKENYPHLFEKTVEGRSPDKNQEAPPQYNPWKEDQWNLTEQGRIVKEDPNLAERLKSAAGAKN